MKVKEERYNREGTHKLFYVAESNSATIIAHVYTPAKGVKEIKFRHLEFELWSSTFDFEYGKYALVIFEDEIAKIILIVTVE